MHAAIQAFRELWVRIRGFEAKKQANKLAGSSNMLGHNGSRF